MRYGPVMLRPLLILCLIILVLPAAVAEPERREPMRVSFELPLKAETNHFGVYMERRKVGWARVSLVSEKREGREVFVSRSRVVADVATGPVQGSLDFDATDVFDAAWPHALLDATERKTDLTGTRRLTLRREGEAYVGETEQGGETTPVRIPDPGYTLVDRMTVLEWMRWRPTAGLGILVREIDISNLRTVHFQYEVLERAMRRAGAARIDCARVSLKSSSMGSLGEVVFDAEGRMLQGPLAGRLEMRMEPAAQAKDLTLESDLFAFGRAPTAEPLGRVQGIQRLELAAYGRGAKSIPEGPRVKVVWNAEDLEARVTLAVGGDGVAATDLEREAALRALDPDAAEHALIRELAARAIGNARGVEARVGRLLGFVRGRLRDAWLPFEPTLTETLRDGAGDASEFARLFVALARASGIPARPVTGLVYLGDDVQAFGGHVWCEILVRGRWQEVDPALGQRKVDATHLPFVRDSSDLVPVLKQSRHLQFEVRKAAR